MRQGEERTQKIIASVVGSVLLALCAMHLWHFIAAWVSVLILHTALIMGSLFFLMTLYEYEDGINNRTAIRSYHAQDIERIGNPYMRIDAGMRLVQMIQLWVLGEYVIGTLLFAAFLVYYFYVRRLRTYDETKLWQDITKATFDNKVLMVFNIIVFPVLLIMMIFSLINGLSSPYASYVS